MSLIDPYIHCCYCEECDLIEPEHDTDICNICRRFLLTEEILECDVCEAKGNILDSNLNCKIHGEEAYEFHSPGTLFVLHHDGKLSVRRDKTD